MSEQWPQVYYNGSIAAQRKKLAHYVLETHPAIAAIVPAAQERLATLAGDNSFAL